MKTKLGALAALVLFVAAGFWLDFPDAVICLLAAPAALILFALFVGNKNW